MHGSLLALVPARSGSKRLPAKNINLLSGKPLICYSIECAQKCPSITRLVVSTDSPEIGRVAREAGAEVPFLRPRVYATDRATTAAVALHTLRFLETEGSRFELLVILQPTSPLRLPEDIEGSLAVLSRTGADSVVGVTKVHVRRSYLCLNDRGFLCRLFSSQAQDMSGPELYKINGAIYLVRVENLLRTGNMMGGRVAPYVMPRIRSLDIDTRDDLYLIGLILEEREKRR